MIVVTNDDGMVVRVITHRKAYRKARWMRKAYRTVKWNMENSYFGWGMCLVIK